MVRYAEISFGSIGTTIGGLFAFTLIMEPIEGLSFESALLGLIFSIIGLIGSFLVLYFPKIGGVLMLTSLVVGLITLHVFYILPSILLLPAILLALIK